MVKCTLICQNPSQRLEMDLSDSLMDMSAVDFSKCDAVLEDGSYAIDFACDLYRREEVASVFVCVNGEQVGSIDLRTDRIRSMDRSGTGVRSLPVSLFCSITIWW